MKFIRQKPIVKTVAFVTTIIFSFSNSFLPKANPPICLAEVLGQDNLRAVAVAQRANGNPLARQLEAATSKRVATHIGPADLHRQLQEAIAARNWLGVREISKQLATETGQLSLQEKETYYGAAKPTKKGTVLITGGAGFIGSILAEELLRQGYNVVALDALNYPFEPSQKPYDPGLIEQRIYDQDIKGQNIQRCIGHPRYRYYGNVDITNPDAVARIFEEQKRIDKPITKVVHLAALAGVRDAFEDPAKYARVDVEGSIRVLEAAEKYGVTDFIQASSSSVYGGAEEGISSTEEDRLRAQTAYAAAKEGAEGMGTHFFNKTKGEMRVSSMRFFTVYGRRGRPQMSMAKFVRCITKSVPIPLYAKDRKEAEKYSRNFTHVKDIVSGLVAALGKAPQETAAELGMKVQAEALNLGGMESVGLMEAVDMLVEGLRDAGFPAKLNIKWEGGQMGDVFESLADTRKAGILLGYTPQMTMRRGLYDLARWYLFWEPFKKAYDEYTRLVNAYEGYSEQYLKDVLTLRDRLEELALRGANIAAGYDNDSEYLVAHDYLTKTYELLGAVAAYEMRPSGKEAQDFFARQPPRTAVTIEEYMERTGIDSRMTARLSLHSHPNICRCRNLRETYPRDYIYYWADSLEDTWAVESPLYHVEYPNGQPVDFSNFGEDHTVIILLLAGTGGRYRETTGDPERDKLVEEVLDKPMSSHVVDAAREVAAENPGKVDIIAVVTDEREMKGASRIKEVLRREDKVEDIIYAYGLNPKGGTGYATMQARAVLGLDRSRATCIITGGDKPGVTADTFRKMIQAARQNRARGLTADILTASYSHPRVIRGKNDGAVKGSLPVDFIEILKTQYGDNAELTLSQIFPGQNVQDDNSRYTAAELADIKEVDADRGVSKGRIVRRKDAAENITEEVVGSIEVHDITDVKRGLRRYGDNTELTLPQIFPKFNMTDDGVTRYTPRQLLEIEDCHILVDGARADLLFTSLARTSRVNSKWEYFLPDYIMSLANMGERVGYIPGTPLEGADINIDADKEAFERMVAAARGVAMGEIPKAATHTLSEWYRIFENPQTSGITSWLSANYLDSDKVAERIGVYRRFLAAAGQSGVFDASGRCVLGRTPCRLRVFGGHTDYIGGGGYLVNAAGEPEMWHIGQARSDRRVVLANADTGRYPSVEFGLDDWDVNPNKSHPRVNTRMRIVTPTDWDSWTARVQLIKMLEFKQQLIDQGRDTAGEGVIEDAWKKLGRKDWKRHIKEIKKAITDDASGGESVVFKLEWAKLRETRWQEFPKGMLAYLQTNLGDPKGRIRKKLRGFNAFIGSEIPPGGLSTSSAVVMSIAKLVNAAFDLGVASDDIVNAGLCEHYNGTTGGMSDHCAIVKGIKGSILLMQSFPETIIKNEEGKPMVVELPQGVSMFLVDSGVKRSEAPTHPKSRRLRQEGIADQAVIMARTGIAYALAALWIRHHFPQYIDALAPNFEQTRDSFGLIREFNTGGKIQFASEAERAKAMYEVLRSMPEGVVTIDQLKQIMPEFSIELDGLYERVREFPPEQARFNLRGYTLYGWAENERAIEFTRRSNKGNFEGMLDVIRVSQDGDRASKNGQPWTYEVTNQLLDEWIANPGQNPVWSKPGWFERSIEEVDDIIDHIERNFGVNGKVAENAASAFVSGAGLGGLIFVLAKTEHVGQIQESLRAKGYVCPVPSIRAGQGAAVVSADLKVPALEVPTAPTVLADTEIEGIRTKALPVDEDIVVIQTRLGEADRYSGDIIRKLKARNNRIHYITTSQGLDKEGLKRKFRDSIRGIDPTIVLLPHRASADRADQVARQVIIELLGEFGNKRGVHRVGMEYASLGMARQYNFYVPLSSRVNRTKRTAEAQHRSQMGRNPFDTATQHANEANLIEGNLLISPNAMSGAFAERFMLSRMANGELRPVDPKNPDRIFVYGDEEIDLRDAVFFQGSPHSDDAEIALGGFISMLSNIWHTGVNFIATNSHRTVYPEELLPAGVRQPRAGEQNTARWMRFNATAKRNEIMEGNRRIGIKPIFAKLRTEDTWGMPFYGRKTTLPEGPERIVTLQEVQLVERTMERYFEIAREKNRPFILSVPQRQDSHPDHRALHRIMMFHMRRLSQQYPEVPVYIIEYVAPWAGEFNAYSYYDDTADGLKQKALGRIKARLRSPETIDAFDRSTEAASAMSRTNALVAAELVSSAGWGGMPKRPEQIGGRHAERFRIFDLDALIIGAYQEALEFFAAGDRVNARTQMRQFLTQDPRYTNMVDTLTDEDIDDIIQVQLLDTNVVSTGCFIQDRIFQINLPAGWDQKRLIGHLDARYGAVLNDLSLIDVSKPAGQVKMRNLLEDFKNWGVTNPVKVTGGGLPLNTSRVLAQLAGRTTIGDGRQPVVVNVYGRLGNDEAGNGVLQELNDCGVHTQNLTQEQGAETSVTYVLSFGDLGRTFIQAINANGKLVKEAIPDEAIKQAAILDIAGTELTPNFIATLPEFLRHAKDVNPNIKIVLDTVADPDGNWNKAFNSHPEAYKLIDLLATSYGPREAIQIVGTDDTDTILKYFIDKGVGAVCLKKGKDGSHIVTQSGKRYDFPVLEGLKVEGETWEETGAGDAHRAALIVGLALGWPIEKTGLLATAVGGRACKHIGGTIENENIVDAIFYKRVLINQITPKRVDLREAERVSLEGLKGEAAQPAVLSAILRQISFDERQNASMFKGKNVIVKGSVYIDKDVTFITEGSGTIEIHDGAHIEKGVSIIARNGQHIVIGRRTTLLAGFDTIITGNVSIGEDCEISGRVTDSVIGDDVKLHDRSVVTMARIGNHWHINGSSIKGYYVKGKGSKHVFDKEGPVNVVVLKGSAKSRKGEPKIRGATIETIPEKKSWGLVNSKNRATAKQIEAMEFPLRNFRVDVRATVIEGSDPDSGRPTVIEEAVIKNTEVKGGTHIASFAHIEHSSLGYSCDMEAHTKVEISALENKVRCGAEVSKSIIGDGCVLPHRSTYVSAIAPNQIPMIDKNGRPYLFNLGASALNLPAGFVCSNNLGYIAADGKTAKGTAVFLGPTFPASKSGVANLIAYEGNPDIDLKNIDREKSLTIVYPFCFLEGDTLGLVFPFTRAGVREEQAPHGKSVKTPDKTARGHDIGWVLDNYPGMILDRLDRLQKVANPKEFNEFVQALLLDGIKRIERELRNPKSHYNRYNLIKGLEIYKAHFYSKAWEMKDDKFTWGGTITDGEKTLEGIKGMVGAYREKQRRQTFRPVSKWLEMFKNIDKYPLLREHLLGIYGEEDVMRSHLKSYMGALNEAVKRLGENKKVCITRAPGRVSLCGHHNQDLEDGRMNYISYDGENILVAHEQENDSSDRRDDIELISASPGQERRFADVTIDVKGEIEVARTAFQKSFDRHYVMDPTIQTRRREAQSDAEREWMTIPLGALLNLIFDMARKLDIRHETMSLKGFKGIIYSNIPPDSGLSSSSALADVACLMFLKVNRIFENPYMRKKLMRIIAMLPYEVYTGELGGKGDLAAVASVRLHKMMRARQLNSLKDDPVLKYDPSSETKTDPAIDYVDFSDDLIVAVVPSFVTAKKTGPQALSNNKAKFSFKLAVPPIRDILKDLKPSYPDVINDDFINGFRYLGQLVARLYECGLVEPDSPHALNARAEEIIYTILGRLPESLEVDELLKEKGSDPVNAEIYSDLRKVAKTVSLQGKSFDEFLSRYNMKKEDADMKVDLKGTAMFFIATVERARMFGEGFEEAENARKDKEGRSEDRIRLLKVLGELMRISHDGDRTTSYNVDTNESVDYQGQPVTNAYLQDLLDGLKSGRGKARESARLYKQPGYYRASIENLDAIVDVANDLAKKIGDDVVIGASLTGAGFGGNAVVLLRKKPGLDPVAELEKALGKSGILQEAKKTYEKINGVNINFVRTSEPIQGASVLEVELTPEEEVEIEKEYNVPKPVMAATEPSKAIQAENVYGPEDNINQGFRQLDQCFGGEITAKLNAKIKIGQKPKILLIGIGRGMGPYDLLREYGDSIEVHSISLENLLCTPEQLSQTADISQEEAVGYLRKIRANYLLHNVESGLPFPDGQFDVVVITQGTLVHLMNKLELLNEVKRVLQKEGEGFTDLVSFKVSGGEATFFNSLRSGEFEIVTFPTELWFVPKEHGGVLGLHIINKNPQDRKIPLQLVSTKDFLRVPTIKAPTYNNTYEPTTARKDAGLRGATNLGRHTPEVPGALRACEMAI